MTRKKVVIIIASLVGVLIIAGGVVVALSLLKGNPASNSTDTNNVQSDGDPLKVEQETTPDLSVDLGACTLFDKAAIAAALTPEITSIPDFENRGFGQEANGDKSQTCLYDFSADQLQNNRLTITVTEFSDAIHKADALTGLKDEIMTKVTGLGEAAAFTTTNDKTLLKQTSYSLSVIKDMRMTTLLLIQPNETDKFTATRGETALTTLAKSAL